MKVSIKIAETFKGFLDADEGETLYDLAIKASKIGPCLEVGSYCGKSATYIGTACKEKSTVLFSIDHHRGSEEHQPGEEYFDLSLFDHKLLAVNTFNSFMENIKKAGLEDTVIPIVSKSNIVAKKWDTQLGMVFIDGSHSYNNIINDYKCWRTHIAPRGYLAFHDIFKNKNQGGQAPYKVYKAAMASGDFIEQDMIKTLGILQLKC